MDWNKLNWQIRRTQLIERLTQLRTYNTKDMWIKNVKILEIRIIIY